MTQAHTKLMNEVFAAHGAREDCRLFRNETAGAWVGKMNRRTRGGGVVLKNARMIEAGLVEGSADIIGIGEGGWFIAIEVKTGKAKPTERQRRFVDMVKRMGGIAGVARSVEDVDQILGEMYEPAKQEVPQEAAG